MKKSVAIFAVVFPIVLMGGWLASLYFDRYSGQMVELKITGYDPRDILSGHYFTYRLDFSPDKVCVEKRQHPNYCICLQPSSSAPATVTWHGDCDDIGTHCSSVFLKGECRWNGFLAGVERFYIPEYYKIATVPPNATVKLSVARSGASQVTMLLVDGKPLAEVMQNKP